jgi:hypothetical protein
VKLECAREQDVLDAVATGRWPSRTDGELRDHVRHCAICLDVAEIAAPLLAERDAAWEEAHVAPSSVVWWRAQIRAREEAARAVARPIALVQGLAVVCLAAVALLLLTIALPWFRTSATLAGTVVAWITPRAVDIAHAFALATGSASPLLLLGAWLVLAPVVLYFALVED